MKCHVRSDHFLKASPSLQGTGKIFPRDLVKAFEDVGTAGRHGISSNFANSVLSTMSYQASSPTPLPAPANKSSQVQPWIKFSKESSLMDICIL